MKRSKSHVSLNDILFRVEEKERAGNTSPMPILRLKRPDNPLVGSNIPKPTGTAPRSRPMSSAIHAARSSYDCDSPWGQQEQFDTCLA